MRRRFGVGIAALAMAASLGVLPAGAATDPPVPEGSVPEAVAPEAVEEPPEPAANFYTYCEDGRTHLGVQDDEYWPLVFFDYREMGSVEWLHMDLIQDVPMEKMVAITRVLDPYYFDGAPRTIEVMFSRWDGNAQRVIGFDLSYYQPYCDSVARISGADRYEVAAQVANNHFYHAETVYIANGLAYADALAGGPIAGRVRTQWSEAGTELVASGPLLLTQAGSLPAVTRQALVNMEPTRVVILGGTASVSPAVESQLRNLGYEVERWAGADRYQVATSISQANFDNESYGAAVITSGLAPADALAAAPVASKGYAPLFLVRQNSIPSEVIAEIERIRIREVLIVGGTGSVSSSVENELKAMGLNVVRVDGASRYEVAANIARDWYTDAETVYVANGLAYADALAAAPLAGLEHGPVLLVAQNSVPAATAEALQVINPRQIIVLGGTGSVSDAVMQELQSLVTE